MRSIEIETQDEQPICTPSIVGHQFLPPLVISGTALLNGLGLYLGMLLNNDYISFAPIKPHAYDTGLYTGVGTIIIAGPLMAVAWLLSCLCATRTNITERIQKISKGFTLANIITAAVAAPTGNIIFGTIKGNNIASMGYLAFVALITTSILTALTASFYQLFMCGYGKPVPENTKVTATVATSPATTPRHIAINLPQERQLSPEPGSRGSAQTEGRRNTFVLAVAPDNLNRDSTPRPRLFLTEYSSPAAITPPSEDHRGTPRRGHQRSDTRDTLAFDEDAEGIHPNAVPNTSLSSPR